MVLVTVIFTFCCIIGMTGTWQIARIVPGARIGVRDKDAERCARGLSFKNSADNFEFVCLCTGSRDFALRSSQRKLVTDKGFINGKSGGYSIQHGANIFAVALTKKCNGYALSKRIFHPLTSHLLADIGLPIRKRHFFNAVRADFVNKHYVNGTSLAFFIVCSKIQSSF